MTPLFDYIEPTTPAHLADRIAGFRTRRPADAQPAFQFPSLPASERLHFAPVDYQNYQLLYQLFHQDNWPFINKYFKDEQRLDEYVVILMEWAKYSAKYGACDWIIYRSADQLPIGVLHVYDLSREGQGKHDHRCTIGFAIQRRFRRQGYAREAVLSLLQYIFTHFHFDTVLAYTALRNAPTLQMLEKLHFRRRTEHYDNTEHFAFFEMQREDLAGKYQ